MSATPRQKGTFVCPFIYGSTAIPFGKKDTPEDPTHTHRWSVYVRGVQGEDLSYLFKKVIIKIHETYPSPSRCNHNVMAWKYETCTNNFSQEKTFEY